MTHPDDLLTSAETAALIGIKAPTLELWRMKGKGPKFAKLGSSGQAPVRYRRGDVAAFIEQCLYASKSPFEVAYGSIDAFADKVNADIDAGKLDRTDGPMMLAAVLRWHKERVWQGWTRFANGHADQR